MGAFPDVVICGAGAAGLTLAIELARRGVVFRLLEQQAQPFQGSRGKGIQPRSQEIFEDMGIVDRLFERGGLYPASRSYLAGGVSSGKATMEAGPDTPAEPYPRPLMVPQFITEAVMRERLAELGHRVEFDHALIGFDQDAEGVTIRIATPDGEETVRARYLVGADGGRSFVRQALDIGFPGKTLGVRAVVADLVLAGLSRDVWHNFNEEDMTRRVSLCPLMGTELFQLQAPVPFEGDVDLSIEGMTSMVRERTGRDDIVIHGVPWASVYRMNARLADRFRDGRIFLVGDAAHVHPPTGGQGLNTSAQDSYNLGWKLASVLRGAPETLLDTYEEERRPIAASVLGLAAQLLDNARRGDNRRGREVQQLDIGYRHSSLSLPMAPPHQRIVPGDRAPDALLHGAGGKARRLFEVLRGTHWTLLGYEVDRSIAPSRAGLQVHAIGHASELQDTDRQFAAAYGLGAGQWILIRPDGYVAAISEGERITTLTDHFDAIQGLGLPMVPAGSRTNPEASAAANAGTSTRAHLP